MKTAILAIAASLFTIGTAHAENPHVGEPPAPSVHNKAPFTVAPRQETQSKRHLHNKGQVPKPKEKASQDGSAHRFGDASPSSYQR